MNKIKLDLENIEIEFMNLYNERVQHSVIEGTVDPTVLTPSYVGYRVLSAWKLEGTEKQLRAHIARVRNSKKDIKILAVSESFNPLPKIGSITEDEYQYYTMQAVYNKDFDLTHYTLEDYQIGDEYYAALCATEDHIKEFVENFKNTEYFFTNKTDLDL